MSNTRVFYWLVILVVLIAIVIGCHEQMVQAAPNVTLTPIDITITPRPTSTKTPTPTNTPTVIPTFVQVTAMTHTPTATSTPVVVPTKNCRHQLFGGCIFLPLIINEESSGE